jgi:hypothetical protein
MDLLTRFTKNWLLRAPTLTQALSMIWATLNQSTSLISPRPLVTISLLCLPTLSVHLLNHKASRKVLVCMLSQVSQEALLRKTRSR